ncbi:MAG: TetR/AcrR family transcriptional regulator [Polaribacter sp.]
MPTKKTPHLTSNIKKTTVLFFKKGYHATSMQDIVDATGLNRSSIYNSFGSKLDLFITCFEKCEFNYRKEVQKIILANQNSIKTIIDIFELSMKESINGYLIPNYISELKNEEPTIRKLIINQQDYLTDLFLNVVKRGQNIGKINNSKSEKQYALYLLNAFQGLRVLSHTKENKNDLKNIIYNTLLLLE